MPSAQSFFADTNIWVYALVQEQAQEKFVRANELLKQGGACVSLQVINETCCALLRLKALAEQEVPDLVSGFYRDCIVSSLSSSTLMEASRLRQRYSFSFWDGLVIASALEMEVPVFYSEDMQHGLVVSDRLQIVNPFV
jgi:predicted nucleic acid-binding protein